jgi:hypothetical protein
MKRLLVLLVIVLVLFAAMLIYGVTRDRSDERASQQPDWMHLLDSFAHKQAVTASDILPSPCFGSEGFRIMINAPCMVHIRSIDSSTLRATKLALTLGLKVQVNLQTLGPTSMNVSLPLRSDTPKSPELQLPKEGADLTLACAQPAPVSPFFCQVSLTR